MTPIVRPPSLQWEPACPPDMPDCGLWVWFFPAHVPTSVSVNVPAAMFAQFGMYLTARRVIAATGLPIEAVASWSLMGTTLETQGGTNPILDQPLPPLQGVEHEVIVTPHAGAIVGEPGPASGAAPAAAGAASTKPDDPMALEGVDDILAAATPIEQAAQEPQAVPPMAAPAPMAAPIPAAAPAPTAAPVAAYAPQPQQVVGGMPTPSVPPAVADSGMPAASGGAVDAIAERVFASITADWRAIEQLERQLASVTKQLNGQASKLQSLNKDLGPQERLAADSNDIKAWTDVRRMLRDAAALISKQVRAFDIGTVSAAGNRNRFSDIFDNYVQKRIPFDHMVETANEFEQHRKICQNLLTQSSAALSGTQRDAEGKARALLAKIAAKARAKR